MKLVRLFVVALLVIAAAAVAPGCGTVGVSASRSGRASAERLVYDQRLVEIHGEEEAIRRLIAQGVPERDARKRVDDAMVAAGGRKEQ
jgi:hypothetical protein